MRFCFVFLCKERGRERERVGSAEGEGSGGEQGEGFRRLDWRQFA